jgi:hypothetical protein
MFCHHLYEYQGFNTGPVNFPSYIAGTIYYKCYFCDKTMKIHAVEMEKWN